MLWASAVAGLSAPTSAEVRRISFAYIYSRAECLTLGVHWAPQTYLQLPQEPDSVDTHTNFFQNPTTKGDAQREREIFKSPKVSKETLK